MSQRLKSKDKEDRGKNRVISVTARIGERVSFRLFFSRAKDAIRMHAANMAEFSHAQLQLLEEAAGLIDEEQEEVRREAGRILDNAGDASIEHLSQNDEATRALSPKQTSGLCILLSEQRRRVQRRENEERRPDEEQRRMQTEAAAAANTKDVPSWLLKAVAAAPPPSSVPREELVARFKAEMEARVCTYADVALQMGHPPAKKTTMAKIPRAWANQNGMSAARDRVVTQAVEAWLRN